MRALVLAFSLLAVGKSYALTNATPALDNVFQTVINISNEGPDGEGGTANGYCNATLVHPRVLVTAAHCLADSQKIRSFKTGIQIGKYKYVTRPDGKVVRVGYAPITKLELPSRYIFPKSMQSKVVGSGKIKITPEEDLALVVLNQDLTTPDAVPLMQTISQQELKSLQTSILKYMPTIVSSNIFSDVSSTDSKRWAQLNDLNWKGGYFKSNSSSRVEEGDSGAPVFVRIGTSWKLVAVVKGRGESIFAGNWDVYTALDSKACELAQQLADPEMKKALCH